MANFIIFGGGMTGLVTARDLARAGHEVHVYEATDRIGGLAKTYKDPDGYTYDNGPRFIFSTLAEKIGIADLCEPVIYYENLYVGGKYYLFPFGLFKNLKYFLSAGLATLTRSFHPKPSNLHEFLRTYYGRLFSEAVLKPLIEKWAGIQANQVSVDFASRLLPTNIGFILYSILKKIRGGITEDYYKKGRYIVYPRTSISAIFDKLSSEPGVFIHTNSPVEHIKTKDSKIREVQIAGKIVQGDYYVSTMPISEMVSLLDNPVPMKALKNLKYRGILILFVKINRPHLLKTLWTWFPESKFRFYRISEFKNAREDLAPKDKTLVSIELACETSDPFWNKTAQEVYDHISKDFLELYGLQKGEIIGFELKKSAYAYPVMRAETEELARSIEHQTPLSNLFVAGRTGMFQYRMLEGCYESATTCVEVILKTIKGEIVPIQIRVKNDPFGRPLANPE